MLIPGGVYEALMRVALEGKLGRSSKNRRSEGSDVQDEVGGQEVISIKEM